jgi:hypothetical protein
MKRKLDIGNSNFKDIIEKNYYYIDKSLLIQDILDSQKQVLLIPRPRRFGKTLNLLMLRYFFEKDKPENKNLFNNLKISKCEKEILDHQGKYPIIYLSFKDAKAETWENTLLHIKAVITQVCREHRYLLESNVLTDVEKKEFSQLIDQTGHHVLFENSLKHLSSYLSRYHKENVVVLVDEYDTPIQAGYKKFYDDVVPFMRNLLSGAFKDNLFLFKGIITGILRVSRESIFTGLNNLSVHTILDEDFSDKFGFTEEEVKQILKDIEVSAKYSQVKEWYDGYTFGDVTDIYNPWSILNFVVSPHKGFKPYWINTSSDGLLKDQVKSRESLEARELVLKLISGGTIEKPIEENFVFPDLDTNKDLLWTLLTFSGYLTIKRQVNRKVYELQIPNFEITIIFQDIILYWFQTEVKVYRNLLEDTANALVQGDSEKFIEGFQKIIGDTFSYYDTASTPEKIYQAYTLGLLTILSDTYIIRSNRESGAGRYDILLIPHDKSKNGIVIELKAIDKKKSKESKKKFGDRVQKELSSALKQIDDRQYYKELISHKVGGVIKVAAVFAGKDVFVEMV